MATIKIREAINSEGATMSFEYSPTNSWQAFTVRGLPSRLATLEGKGLSLAKAIEVWNLSLSSRKNALQTSVVSASIRKILDAARDAKAAAAKTRPIPVCA